MLTRIRKGLDIPLAGVPRPEIEDGRPAASVALLGRDTHGIRPALAVQQGERVRCGQTLYTDKRNPAVRFTAPGAGRVSAIHRGERRALQSVVIELDGDAAESFPVWERARIARADSAGLRENLLASGLWTALRTRPYSRIPAPDSRPHSLFVTAIDTNPLAPDPAQIIAGDAEAFTTGLGIVSRLGDGPTYLCTRPGAPVPRPDDKGIVHAEFAGPHPAGLVGTHIHFLDPVAGDKVLWHIGYQDVMAIGTLFLTGRLPVERIVALGGPKVISPRLLRTRSGASLRDLLHGETEPGPARIVSGSALSGHRAVDATAWLGRYHNQVTVLQEGSPREFLAWLAPGMQKYSALRAYLSHLAQKRLYPLTTSQNGSPRAMVSIGSFERVMPLDILPTPLLKALLVADTDSAKELGCLELDEEDLALCSFVCNGKYEYGPYLRMTLDEIEANG